MRVRSTSPSGAFKSPASIRSVVTPFLPSSIPTNSIKNSLPNRRSTFRYFDPMADIEATNTVEPKLTSSFNGEFREETGNLQISPNTLGQIIDILPDPMNDDQNQKIELLQSPSRNKLRSSSVSFAAMHDKDNGDDRSDFERGLEMGMVLGLRLEDEKRDELADRLERDFSAGNSRDFILMAENGAKRHYGLFEGDNFYNGEDSNFSDGSNKSRRKDRFKAFMRHFVTYMFSHVGICFLVVGYTLMGAFTFQALEYPNEKMLHANVLNMRQKVAQNIWKITRTYTSQQKMNWSNSVDSELLSYQNRLIKLVQRNFNGTHVRSEDFRPKWSLNEAFLYSLTVITTIGYGNLTPKTLWGKIVTIIYAIFGIPILLLYLSNIGGFLAHLFKYFYVHTLYLCCNEKARKRKSFRSKSKKMKNSKSYNAQYDVLMESGVMANHRGATQMDASLVGSEFEDLPITLNFEDSKEFETKESVVSSGKQKSKLLKQKSTKKSKKKMRENISLELPPTSHIENETLEKDSGKNKRSVSMKAPKSNKSSTKKSLKSKEANSKKMLKMDDEIISPQFSTKPPVERSKSSSALNATSIRKIPVDKSAPVGDVKLLIYTDPAYYLQSTRLRLLNPSSQTRSPSDENFQIKSLKRDKIIFLGAETQRKSLTDDILACQVVGNDDNHTQIQLVRSESQFKSSKHLSRSKSLPSRSKHRLANSQKNKHHTQSDARNLSFSTSYSSITVPVWLTLLILFLYVIAGTILFSTWEEWDYIDGSYFCFITLSTIGFGDLVPGETVMGVNNGDSKEKLAITSLYILIGMAIIAMCFNLMQEQVTKSFRNLGIRLGIVRDNRL